MECKFIIAWKCHAPSAGIDLTRMECKGSLISRSFRANSGIDLTRMECKVKAINNFVDQYEYRFNQNGM